MREWLLQPALTLLRTVIMKQAELVQQLQTVSAQVEKVKTEVTDRIAQLEAAIGDADVSQEVQDALANLKTAVQGVDDITVDTVVGEVQDQGVQR